MLMLHLKDSGAILTCAGRARLHGLHIIQHKLGGFWRSPWTKSEQPMKGCCTWERGYDVCCSHQYHPGPDPLFTKKYPLLHPQKTLQLPSPIPCTAWNKLAFLGWYRYWIWYQQIGTHCCASARGLH